MGLIRGECLLNLVQRGGKVEFQLEHTGTIVAVVYVGVGLMEGFLSPLEQHYWLSACPFHIWAASGISFHSIIPGVDAVWPL